MTDFNAALTTFVAGAQVICTENDKDFPNVKMNTTLSVDPKGRRYKRIVRTDACGGNSVHCFVDTTNGNVLKAAGWATPAKHARGNIFDDSNGLARMSCYGPAYLR